jgi:hypothetical protein
MKNTLYIIRGKHNVECFDDFDEEAQNIDTSKVRKIEFSTEEDRQKTIDLMYNIEGFYTIIDENEYNLIVN